MKIDIYDQSYNVNADQNAEYVTELAAYVDLKMREVAEAHAEIVRRQSFTDALLETIEVGIVSCDAEGVFLVSNRAEREMFGLQAGLQGLLPEQLGPLIDVFGADGGGLAVQDIFDFLNGWFVG